MWNFIGSVLKRIAFNEQTDYAFLSTWQSHPVGIDGQNHITAITPLKFLPIQEFEKRQKSMELNTALALINSIKDNYFGIELAMSSLLVVIWSHIICNHL